jgi:hypothetical protein
MPSSDEREFLGLIKQTIEIRNDIESIQVWI